jgi:GTP-binding protein HflX
MTNRYMVFNKIGLHIWPLTSDLMTEKPRHYTLEEWKSTWMSRVGEENALFISATNKENFEEFRDTCTKR